MKRSQLAILVLLVLVLGGAALVLVMRSTTSWQSSAGHLPAKVVNLSINDVVRITFTQPAGQVNLVKKGDKWVVAERANYPANFEMISAFIRKVWELKPVQEQQVGPSQLGRLDLLEPGQGSNSGTLVDFKAADGKRLAAVLLGKKYLRESDQSFAQGRSFPAGRYVMPEDGSHQVSLVTDPFAQADDKAERWLDHGFIKIEKPISIACAGQSPAVSWTLERGPESTEWKWVDARPGEQLDEIKAKQIASAVGSLSSFVDVLAPDAKPETTGLDNPVTFTIMTEDGFTYVLGVGKKIGEQYPVTIAVSANIPAARTPAKDEKAEEKTKLDKDFQTKREALEKKLRTEKGFEGRPFLISKFSIEQLEKSRTDLLAPKATPTATPSPTPERRK
ncbi:MAG: DUF4340 domain-containing protein [Chthoniobacterales bacterium]